MVNQKTSHLNVLEREILLPDNFARNLREREGQKRRVLKWHSLIVTIIFQWFDLLESFFGISGIMLSLKNLSFFNNRILIELAIIHVLNVTSFRQSYWSKFAHLNAIKLIYIRCNTLHKVNTQIKTHVKNTNTF